MSITRVDRYNPVNMALAETGISEVDFGGVIRGNHCAEPVVVLPVVGGTVTQLALFLEESGNQTNAQFGYLASKEKFSGIQAGGAQMSDHFTETPGVSDFSFLENGVSMDPDDPEYVWLDVEVGLGADIGSSTGVNYRFIFEYN